MFGFGMAELILLPFILVGLLIPLVTIVLWIYCLADVLKSTFREESDKIVWVLVIILVPLIGSILYLVIGRNRKAPGSDGFSIKGVLGKEKDPPPTV